METMKKCQTCGGMYEGELCPRCVAQFAQRPTDATSPTGPEEMPLKVGETFRGLEVVGLLGRGGMGVVYKARQPALDRMVALKILTKKMALDPDFQGRFIREAKALASLSHPNIVGVYDFGAENGLFFFAMEFVDGVSLRQVVRDRKLTSDQALKLVPQLCDALEYAHGEGVVHRDIKPENILLDRKGRVKIADFGLAKITGQDIAVQLTQTNMVMGTPHYMAPEQIENPKSVDHRADIYSMGVVFYEMLTGELPIGRFEPPSKKVAVDVRIDDVVLRTLEKEPARRYQHASEVKQDVTRVTEVAKVDSYAPTMVTPPPKKDGRKGPPWAAIAAAAAVLIALGAVLALRPPPAAEEAKKTVQPPPPAPEAPVELERIYFTVKEGPLGRGLMVPDPQKNPFAPRNPFPAKAPEELDQFVKSLDHFSLQNVARADVTQGYLIYWYGCVLIAMHTNAAERLERDIRESTDSFHQWAWRRGTFLVLVRAFARDPRSERAMFADAVRRAQEKLGLRTEPPDLPLRNIVIDKDEMSSGWLLSESWGGDAKLPVHDKAAVAARLKVPPALLSAGYAAAYERAPSAPSIAYVAAQFEDASKCEAAEKAIRAQAHWENSVKTEVIRTARTLAVLSLHGDEFGSWENLAMKLRVWMGGPRMTMETLTLREHELPSGIKFTSAENDGRKALDAFGLGEVRASDLQHAFHATFDNGTELILLEMKEERAAWDLSSAVRSRLGKEQQNFYRDGFFCAVRGDGEKMMPVENRMREKFGMDVRTR